MKFYVNNDFTGGVLPNNIVYLNAKDESGKDFLVYYHAPFDNNEHAFKLLTDLSSGKLDLPDYRKNADEMQNWTTDINSIYENYVNGDLESSPEDDDSREMDEFAKSESNKAFEGMFGITRERYEEIAKAQDLKMYTMGVLSDVQEVINDRTQERRLNLVKLIIDTQLENKQVVEYLSNDKEAIQVDRNNKLLLTTEHFEVVISPSSKHGSFEHVEFGEEYGGGLWFDDNKELDEFDGVMVLPEEVADAIIQLGYKVDKKQFCGEEVDKDASDFFENDRVKAALALKEKVNNISNVPSASERVLMSKDLETDDRYGSIEDIEISFEDGIDHVHNGISYATATKPDTNQMEVIVGFGKINKKVPVNSFKEASNVFVTIRDSGGYGARDMNFGCGNVLQNGELIGRISYNGRAWDKNDNPIQLDDNSTSQNSNSVRKNR